MILCQQKLLPCVWQTHTSSSVSADEKVMAEAFQAILKNGANSPVIKQALLCHLMAGEYRLEIVVAKGNQITGYLNKSTYSCICNYMKFN